MTSRSRRRPSLRAVLPLLFAIPVVLVLATFVWATSRQVERALTDAGRERADLAAAELASTLSQALGSLLDMSEAVGRDERVRSFVAAGGDAGRQEAIAALLPSATPALRRTELWDARGNLLLEVVTAPADTAAGLRAYPPGTAPRAAGISPFQAADTLPYFDIVSAIPSDTTEGAVPIGYMRRFARLSGGAAERIASLVGGEAVIRVGAIENPVWTDFSRVFESPPHPLGGQTTGVYRAGDGQRWIGAIAVVHRTPWVVWVGFPVAVVLQPARPFMRAMTLVSILLVLAGLGLVTALAYRLTRPLRSLAGAADSIALGDYTQRVEPAGFDEVSRLGEAFNTMAERVEQAHSALRASHSQTQFALAAARIGVWEVDLATGVITCSESMRYVHPGSPSDLHACDDFLEDVHPEHRDSMRAILEGRAPAGDAFDLYYRVVDQDGSVRWIEGKGRIERDATGKPRSVLGVSIDVTERRRLEAQLMQSQKMDALGQLAGGVAHDFNNLLTVILGHANLIASEVAGDSPLNEDVQGILSAGESATGLTRQLLMFSRKQSLEPRLVDVNDLIRRTQKLLRRLIGENIAIDARLEPELPAVRVDPGSLEQVIVNLAVNARDAMSGSGTLTIATAVARLEAGDQVSGGVARAPYVLLTVTDTGAGMSEETLARIFEPFFTTKPAGEGTGLGLATVFGIVKQSDGHVTVDSRPGRGTTFSIYLPALAAAPAGAGDDVATAG